MAGALTTVAVKDGRQQVAAAADGVDERMKVANRQLQEITGHLNVQHAALVDVAVELLELRDEGGWILDGLHTVELYLGWRAGLAPATAAKVVTVARRAHEFPTTIEAFRNGMLTLDQVATAVHRRVPSGADASIRSLAGSMTVTQLRRTVNTYNFGDDATDGSASDALDGAHRDSQSDSDHEVGPAEPDEAHAASSHHGDTDLDAVPPNDTVDAGASPGTTDTHSEGFDEGQLWFGHDELGRFALHFTGGDPDTARLIELALTEARDRLFRDQHGDSDAPNGISWIEAMRNVCMRSLAFDGESSRSDRYRSHFHVDLDRLEARRRAVDSGTDGPHHVVPFASDVLGQRIPDAIARYLSCDGIATTVFERNGRPVSVGRTQRLIPERTRLTVLRRDGGCQAPGCRATHGLEIHHIIHWSFGGPTDTWNLITLCARHHRLHHRGLLGISGNADVPGDVRFTDRSGRPLPHCAMSPIPPAGPPPPPPQPYEHPVGERLDRRDVYVHVSDHTSGAKSTTGPTHSDASLPAATRPNATRPDTTAAVATRQPTMPDTPSAA